MGTLYLVRHGQASFGADNYDVLSDLGHRQARRLGEYFKSRGLSFDAAFTGTLNRQVQTFTDICRGLGAPLQAVQRTALNEYDSEAIIAAVHPKALEKPDSPESMRQHFRLLKQGLTQWMAGKTSPGGMPGYDEFVLGITDTLDHIRGLDGNVLLVSSGGPIAVAVSHVLGTRPEVTIDLNLRIRNCSLTEMAFNPKRHMLVSYNAVPHLEAPEHADWVTYA